MKRVRQVRPEPGYRLWVEFEDGVAGTLDLSSELDGPVFEPLRDARAFEQVAIERAINQLLVVYHSDDHELIRAHIELLNQTTMRLAEVMMNAALRTALKGKTI